MLLKDPPKLFDIPFGAGASGTTLNDLAPLIGDLEVKFPATRGGREATMGRYEQLPKSPITIERATDQDRAD